jgi:hypothetical protein
LTGFAARIEQPAGTARGHSENITLDPAPIETMRYGVQKCLKAIFLVLAATGTSCLSVSSLQAGFPCSNSASSAYIYHCHSATMRGNWFQEETFLKLKEYNYDSCASKEANDDYHSVGSVLLESILLPCRSSHFCKFRVPILCAIRPAYGAAIRGLALDGESLRVRTRKIRLI